MIIKSYKELKEITDSLKISNKKIVSTNGCFDVLHKGHILYLQEAKKLGDVLIVGLNSDKSVRKLKGKNRPINDEDSRLILVDALEVVDFVVIFNEDTPIELLKNIEPRYHVKGGDYSGVLPETEIIENGGGELVFVKFIDGFSSTRIINKIKEV